MEGISHITFIVRDLERATTIFTELFDAKETYASGEKTYSISREKFFLIGDLWIAIMEGESLPSKTYNHIAFKVKKNELGHYRKKIEQLELEILEDRSRIEGEGNSLYFYDDDGHLFELHTGTLEERLKKYNS